MAEDRKIDFKITILWALLQAFEELFRVFNNSEVKGAHFRILLEKVPIFAKNVRFLYYREANKKRHPPLKVAPMCAKVHFGSTFKGMWRFLINYLTT